MQRPAIPNCRSTWPHRQTRTGQPDSNRKFCSVPGPSSRTFGWIFAKMRHFVSHLSPGRGPFPSKFPNFGLQNVPNQTSVPPLQKRFDFHTLVLFYKMRKNLTPSYLSSLMPSPSSTSGYQFHREPYAVPAVSKISSLASFIPRSIILWNTLPSSVQSAKTVSQFN